MGSPKFCLRWNEFETNLSVAFRELWENRELCDVSLVCGDGQVQAHKVILSASSPFFRQVLKENSNSHLLLYLKGVKYKELLSVLNFMYEGEVNVTQDELDSFMAVAEDLRVKGLTPDFLSPPSKRHCSTPHPPSSTSRESKSQEDDEEGQEVVSVKSELHDLLPASTSMSSVEDKRGVQQYGGSGTPNPNMAPLGTERDTFDDTYGNEDGYDHSKCGNDGMNSDYGAGGMIDSNKCMPVKVTDVEEESVEAKIANKIIPKFPGEKFWHCADCDFKSIYRSELVSHIRNKHVRTEGCCPICNKLCSTKKSLRSHKSYYNH